MPMDKNIPNPANRIGNHENLRVFRLSRLVYDITAHFVELYVPANSRTRDQMVQAARSVSQNIAEGNNDYSTSAKIGINLFNVACGSLKELQCDYQDFLRQHSYGIWANGHPLADEFIRRRVANAAEFRDFIGDAMNTGQLDRAELVANATLLLIKPIRFMLSKLIDTKMDAFLKQGGFSEKMYQLRSQKRQEQG